MNKLIKFETPGCRYCQMVENYLNENGIKSEKINPLDNPDSAVKYNIGMSVPVTILVDDNDNEIARSNGFNEEELEGLIAQL